MFNIKSTNALKLSALSFASFEDDGFLGKADLRIIMWLSYL